MGALATRTDPARGSPRAGHPPSPDLASPPPPRRPASKLGLHPTRQRPPGPSRPWAAQHPLHAPPTPAATGWDDQRFFMAQSPMSGRLADGLRALLAPNNPSAIRFDGLSDAPDRIYDARFVRPLRLSHAGLARLVARIDRSLTLAGGQP